MTNSNQDPSNLSATLELQSPAELNAEYSLDPYSPISIKNYGVIEGPTTKKVWEYSSGGQVRGTSVLNISVRSTDGVAYDAEVVQVGGRGKGTSVIGEDYDDSTAFTPGKYGLEVVFRAGSFETPEGKSPVISIERYGIVLKDAEGKPTGWFGELYPGNDFESDEVKIGISEDDELVVHRLQVDGEVIISVNPLTDFTEPDLSEPWAPLNGGRPDIAVDPSTGEQVKPASINWRLDRLVNKSAKTTDN